MKSPAPESKIPLPGYRIGKLLFKSSRSLYFLGHPHDRNQKLLVRFLKKNCGFDRLGLHARSLTLTHPMTGARLHLTAPLPEHMARTWAALEWREADVPEDPFEDIE